MMKILITGATDGIGLETAKMLVNQGHALLIHGRSEEKLKVAIELLHQLNPDAVLHSYLADLSDLDQVKSLAGNVIKEHDDLDVLINNAGVLKTPKPVLDNGQDVRFVVNTIAPYLLTQLLLPIMGEGSRIVNLSSAAQAPVSIEALQGGQSLDDMGAYSQSKLAITMWTKYLAEHDSQRVYSAVNPGSLLASKMVKEGFGVTGNDLSVGAGILCRAALDEEFANYSGEYYDNDNACFAPREYDEGKQKVLVATLESLID